MNIDANTMTARNEQAFAQYADRIALHHLGRDWTYAELDRWSAQVAVWLRDRGLRPGERVAMALPNSAEYVACYLGALRAGGVVVALNPDTTARELGDTLAHCEASAAVVAPQCEGPFQEALPRLETVRIVLSTRADGTKPPLSGVQCLNLGEIGTWPNEAVQPHQAAPSDVAQIIYTSGTSGRPKGVTLTQRNLAANCDSIIEYLGLSKHDSVFVILPFFYSYGNSLLITHLAVGGKLVLTSDFVFWNRALDLMEQQRTTGFAGVPSSYAMLLHKSNFAQRAWHDLRYVTCAGGGLAPAVVERLRVAAPKAQIYLMYGQTEATARLSSLMPDEIDRRPGSIGKGIPGVTLEVLDDDGRPVAPSQTGEIVALGENIMLGYWNDHEETRRVIRADGLHTGDLARVDDDGYVYIVGRKSDMIKSGAYRINPAQIEEIILEMEGVAEVAVVGLPDEILGEVPIALVVPTAQATGLAAEQILRYANEGLPRHKAIRSVRLVAALEKTASGKIKRSEMRRIAREAMEQAAIGPTLNTPADCTTKQLWPAS